MQFASLGSGSRGNSLIVRQRQTAVLIDCGFSLKEVNCRLANLGVEAASIHAVVVTHEHTDHISGVGALARKFSIPVYTTAGTRRGAPWGDIPKHYEVLPDHAFSIGELEFLPFPVPHDAKQPCQYVVTDGNSRLGVLTDTGSITPHIAAQLTRCEAMVLECNHDTQMLLDGDYPQHLKQRIAGGCGHLSNRQAADLIRKLDCSRLKHLVAAHLSEKNNTATLARRELSAALDCASHWIDVIDQYDGIDWRDL